MRKGTRRLSLIIGLTTFTTWIKSGTKYLWISTYPTNHIITIEVLITTCNVANQKARTILRDTNP